MTPLESAVAARFAALAAHPAGEHRFPVGPASAKRLGYDPAAIDALPGPATESFAGVGCPLALGRPLPGQTVLDIGCGAGLDVLLAARAVGPTGRAIGVDFTPAMVAKAEANAALVGLTNTSFRAGRADALPAESGSVDLVVSNGVFNLCVDKPAVAAELFRVLRSGGRLQMADVLLEPHVTPEQLAGMGEWSD